MRPPPSKSHKLKDIAQFTKVMSQNCLYAIIL